MSAEFNRPTYYMTCYLLCFKKAVLQYGMWDQVRVDHGTEFYLTLYMQERNAANWLNTSRQPYIQSQLKRVRVDHVSADNILIS